MAEHSETRTRSRHAYALAMPIAAMLIGLGSTYADEADKGPYLGTGIKIGEVTRSEAIIWARLTANPTRVGNDAPIPTILYKNDETGELEERRDRGRPDRVPAVRYPDGYNVGNVEGATPGSDGEVRVKYRARGEKIWTKLDWQRVDPEHVFARQFELSGLSADTDYDLLVQARPLNCRTPSASLKGLFKTAPATNAAAEVNFIVTTGTSYGDVDSESGYRLYPSSLKLDPEFFVHTGDIVYYDSLGKNLDLAKLHWDRMYSYPNNIEYHRQVPSYFIKDDHDTWMNDAYPGMNTRFMGEFTYEQGTDLFLDEVPMGDKTYRTIRWGKDLQIWLVEGRDFRSPNPMRDGPGKTIWGKEQIDWFKSTVEASDATWKVLISPTPIVGPDRVGNKSDNHANEAFTYEGDMLRKFISEQKNMVVVCGDRHWQYVSKDAETGLLEFSSGPGSDAHAGGWSNENRLPEHIYLNVVGGFLEGIVSQAGGTPSLIFRHHDPDGALLNEYTVGPRKGSN
jgi:alkaline phosphatase D